MHTYMSVCVHMYTYDYLFKVPEKLKKKKKIKKMQWEIITYAYIKLCEKF